MYNPTIKEAWIIAIDWCRWTNLSKIFGETWQTFKRSAWGITICSLIPATLLSSANLLTTALFIKPIVITVLFIVSASFINALTLLRSYAPDNRTNTIKIMSYFLFLLAFAMVRIATNPLLITPATSGIPMKPLLLTFMHTSVNQNIFKRIWLAIKNVFWMHIYFAPTMFAVGLLSLVVIIPVIVLVLRFDMALLLGMTAMNVPWYILFAGVVAFNVFQFLNCAFIATFYRKIYHLTGQDAGIE
jgi:hypothetical protein